MRYNDGHMNLSALFGTSARRSIQFMKKLLPFFVVMCICAYAATAYAEMKSMTFKKEEIKKMAETRAVIETKFGNIELKFFPDAAPNHVNNFIELAKKGFYDGTTFHRVIPGFMIQGGDPNSKDPDKSRHGMGGPGHTVKAEFSAKSHKRGILSMARSANPDSAGSQFFICVADAPFLDRQYTVFGEVVSGMDAVDKIVSQPRDPRDNPNERIEMKVKIIEK
jgi:peptidyl-prolyl cis-trans isomerase B (cyclophilin B)